MLVGQNPGVWENLEGRPFIGAAGQQLDSMLMQCGISRDEIWITNTCRCLTPSNNAPKPEHIEACRKWLDIEIGLVDPDIIVAMGAPAMAWFLGQGCGSVEHLHGKPIELIVGSRKRIVIPSYHPAAALHNTTLLRQLNDDFRVLSGVIAGRPLSDYNLVDEYPNPDYRVLDKNHSEIMVELFNQKARQVAVDTETVKQNTKLWSVQLSTQPGTGWFVPVNPNFKGKLDTTLWNTQVIVHHYLADIKWLVIPEDNFFDSMVAAYLLGLPQGLKELASRLCGMKMQSYSDVVRPGQRKMSLDYLTEATAHEWPDPTEIDETKWDNKVGKLVTKQRHPWHISRKIKKLLEETKNVIDVDPYQRWKDIPELERIAVEKKLGIMPESSLADIPFDDAVQYAVADSDATLRVKLKLEQLIHEAGLDFVLHMDMGILPMVDEMMRNGMPVDINHFKNLSVEYDARMRAKTIELGSLVGHTFNPNSRLQVAQVVYSELGFTPTGFTPTKEISTDDQELKKTGHPVAKGIIEYRRLSKLKGTYADNMAQSPVGADGVARMHTVIKTTRVETGRLSSAKNDDGEGANLQNIPTRSKDGKQIKAGFIAPDGRLMLEGDLAQIEVCTQAHLAQCKGLIDLFLRGDDPHTLTASKIFDVPYEEAKKEKYRYPTKRANFGVIYMIGAEGLSAQIAEYISDLKMDNEPVEVEPWTVDECQKFIDQWYLLYPEVRDYQMDKAAQARRYGYVSDLFGRRRFIPEVNSPVRSVVEEGLRKAANFAVTSTAQGIIKLAMGTLWRELPKSGYRDDVEWNMQIHDSLVNIITDNDKLVADYIKWMRGIVTGVVQLSIPVKMDFKIGKNWSDLKKVVLEEKK
jgi:uracil-DNA glycosylase family 4